jgi:hypothetical protein
MTGGPTKIERCSVSVGRQRLVAGGLEKMDGTGDGGFELWIRKDGSPEMVPYASNSRQEFVKDAIDEILRGTPF